MRGCGVRVIVDISVCWYKCIVDISVCVGISVWWAIIFLRIHSRS